MKDQLETELIMLIEEEYELFCDDYQLNELADRHEAFANYAKTNINEVYGENKFDDFNIESYANDYMNNLNEEN